MDGAEVLGIELSHVVSHLICHAFQTKTKQGLQEPPEGWAQACTRSEAQSEATEADALVLGTLWLFLNNSTSGGSSVSIIIKL